MSKKIFAIITLLALVVSVFAQDKPTLGQKISKEARRTTKHISQSTRKVETYTNKESKGVNHAAQKTERRHASGVIRHDYAVNSPAGHAATHHRTTRHHRRHRRTRRHHTVHHTTKHKS